MDVVRVLSSAGNIVEGVGTANRVRDRFLDRTVQSFDKEAVAPDHIEPGANLCRT
jgi:hypothetical protein